PDLSAESLSRCLVKLRREGGALGADRVDERPCDGLPHVDQLDRDLRQDVEALAGVEKYRCVAAAANEDTAVKHEDPFDSCVHVRGGAASGLDDHEPQALGVPPRG